MDQVSKFIPMDGNSEEQNNPVVNEAGNEGVKAGGSAFKVCGADGSNLPVKTSFWSKLHGVLTYQIKVELTPYEQKIEDEINDFLHQEVTWQSFKDFLFQDVKIERKSK